MSCIDIGVCVSFCHCWLNLVLKDMFLRPERESMYHILFLILFSLKLTLSWNIMYLRILGHIMRKAKQMMHAPLIGKILWLPCIFRLVIHVNGRYAYECFPFELSLGLLHIYLIFQDEWSTCCFSIMHMELRKC